MIRCFPSALAQAETTAQQKNFGIFANVYVVAGAVDLSFQLVSVLIVFVPLQNVELHKYLSSCYILNCAISCWNDRKNIHFAATLTPRLQVNVNTL